MKAKRKNGLNILISLFILFIIIGCNCNLGEGTNSGGKDDPTFPTTNTDSPPTDDGGKADKGDFVVEYPGVKNPRYKELDSLYRKGKTLEKAANKLNRELKLPNDITITAKDCGTPNAFYDPRNRTITMCYEFLDRFYRVFKARGFDDQKALDKMRKVTTFFFLHELGHAVIHNYELPVTANQEDAADRCSAYICIEELGEQGVDSVIAAGEYFAFTSNPKLNQDKRMLSDEHLLNEQRFFNALCMVFGSDPSKYSGIVTNGHLPKHRAARCPTEYKQTISAWEKLLKPWRK